MNATEPLERPDRGNADVEADKILTAYFDSLPAEDKELDPDQGEEQPSQAAEETAAQDDNPTPQDESQAPDMASQNDAGDSEEGEQSYTLAELAAHLDLDQQAIYAAQLKMDNGKLFSVGELKNQWQDAQRELATARANQQQLAQQQAALQQQAQELQARQGLAQIQPDEEEKKLYADLIAYQRAEQDQAYWDLQAKQDPGATALALSRLQQQRRDTEQKLQSKVMQRQQATQEKHKELAAMSQREIATRIPDWSDQSKMRQDWTDIQGLWQRFGLEQSAIETLWQSPPAMHLSHTFLRLLRKLEAADPAKKKVVPLKGLKAGKARGESKPKNPKLEALTKAAKKGNRRAQEAVGAEILKNYL